MPGKLLQFNQLFKGKTIWLLLDWNTMGVLRDRDRNTVALGSSVNAFFKSLPCKERIAILAAREVEKRGDLPKELEAERRRAGLQLRPSQPDSIPSNCQH